VKTRKRYLRPSIKRIVLTEDSRVRHLQNRVDALEKGLERALTLARKYRARCGAGDHEIEDTIEPLLEQRTLH